MKKVVVPAISACLLFLSSVILFIVSLYTPWGGYDLGS